MLSRVCDLFFSNRVRLCAVLLTNDDDVLVLPGAVSTPVDVCIWLVNLPTMVSLSDWREFFYFISFVSVWLFSSLFQWKLSSSLHQKYVFWSNNILCESRETLECYLSQTCTEKTGVLI